MVSNSQSRSNSRDDDVTMSPIHDDVMMPLQNASCSSSTLDCPHCDFKCESPTMMTQHSWEQHPLLMRRKKHLINTRQEAGDESGNGSVVMQEKVEEPVTLKTQVEDHHELENDKQSTDVTSQEISQVEEAPVNYREKAMRSISLLSTAAAILESQSVLSKESQQPKYEMQTNENPIPVTRHQLETIQPYMAPLCTAYVPSLNQYITIPLHMTPISNPSNQNSIVQYLQVQQRNTNFPPMADRASTYSCYPSPKPQMANLKSQSPPKQTTKEIRNLLTTGNAPASPIEQTRHNSRPRKVSKGPRSKQAAQNDTKNGNSCPLGEERRKQLEDALLSLDYCNINDSSTTMPFKCSDGVWRMVKFKCIKGLWVVQTPDSNTPTVYVPCDDDKTHPKAINNGRHKRKPSDDLDFDVDSKRLCASAPVLTQTGSEDGPSPPLKRTLSNPFITKQLPAPSQYFTSNEGKRVNISVVKRSTTSSSSNLIKSLLLRKPSPTIMTSPSGSSSTSSADDKMCCRHNGGEKNGIATAIGNTILKSSMAF